MLRTGVTIGCAAAMVVAALLTVRLRSTERTQSPLSGGEPFKERLAVTVGRASGMLAGAMVAGVLTVGAGGRLMMRVLAATSSEAAQGRITEADEIVGRVSAGGSIFLIALLGIGGGVVGLALFVTLRPWLPDRSLAAGLIGMALGAGALVRPTGLLDATNRDFALLTPVALAVALCLGTLLLFGATFGVLVDHLAPRWPRPGWSPRGLLALLPFALLLLSPPVFIGAAIATLGGSAATGRRSRVAPDLVIGSPTDSARTRGRFLVTALGGLGGLSVIVAAGQVLAV